MQQGSYRILKDKVVLRIRDRICDTPAELLSSTLFLQMLTHSITTLTRRDSRLLDIFERRDDIDSADQRLLVETLIMLTKLRGELVPCVVPGSAQFFRDPVKYASALRMPTPEWGDEHSFRPNLHRAAQKHR